jgi:hypothetical protein
VKPNPQKKFRSIRQSVLALQSRIQNPRCPHCGHLGFGVVLVFERNLAASEAQSPTKTISGKSEQVFLSYWMEAKLDYYDVCMALQSDHNSSITL